jgi:hypothetical protein
VIASAADRIEESIEVGRTFQVEAPTLTLKPLKKGMVWVCVGVPGFGTFCKLERPEPL